MGHRCSWIASMNFKNADAFPPATNSSSDGIAEVQAGDSCSQTTQRSSFSSSPSELSIGFRERAFSAAGAAFLSAIIVNPLDVVKTRLQAQAAEAPSYSQYHQSIRARMLTLGGDPIFAEMKCPPVCPRGGAFGSTPLCPPSCFQYKGALDVFYKIIRQEGFFRLWRGTNAGLALAIPTVMRRPVTSIGCHLQVGDWNFVAGLAFP